MNNILDEPISEAVKERPLLPKKYRLSPPPRKAKERKKKAIIKEFDPAPIFKPFRTIQDYQKEILEMFKEASKNGKLVFRKTPWAIGKFLRGWQMNVPQGHPLGADPKAFLDDVRPQIRKKLSEEVVALKGVKFQLALKISLRKDRPDGAEEYLDPVLRHRQEAPMRAGEINEALDKALPRVLELLEKWTQRGSGWAVHRVETLWLDIARYKPLRGGSYIPLPAAVKNKKAVVNVKNKDDHCLRWALRSADFPADDHVDRPTKYPTKDGLDPALKGVDAPTPISQVAKVERQGNRAINIFGWDKGVIIHQLSKQPHDMPRTNLLLIEKAGKFHYTWIKNLNRLLYDQSEHRERKHFCERCLHGYTREDLLEAHKPECRGIGQTAVRVEMPEEGKNKLAFQNYHKQLPVPFIIYADCEALTTKIAGPELNPSKSNTQKTQHHEACGYSYVVIRCDGETSPPTVYRGPDTMERFLKSLQEEERKIKATLANPQAMRMTPEDRRTHNNSTHCHVCAGPLASDIHVPNIHVPRTVNTIPLPQYNADKRCQRVHVFITPEVYR